MANYNFYTNLRRPRDVTAYNIFRGTTDWSALSQFDYYETGYPYLVMVSYPEFLRTIEKNDHDGDIANLIKNYNHIIEYEFVGLDSGIDDINSEDQEINNGMQSMTVLTKTVAPAGTKFSMTYKERAGGVLSRLHEFYLRSTRDPSSSFKTYAGLIGRSDASGNVNASDSSNGAVWTPDEISFDKETWSFLYMHTDPTGLALEQAIYYVGCYPTSANISQYQGKKGDIAFSDVSVEFSGFPIRGAIVNYRAKQILDYMNDASNQLMVRRNSWDFRYKAIGDEMPFGAAALATHDTYDPTAYYLDTVGSNGVAVNSSGKEYQYIEDSKNSNSRANRNSGYYNGTTNNRRVTV